MQKVSASLKYQVPTEHYWIKNIDLTLSKGISMTERKRAIGGYEKGLLDSLRPFFWDVDFENLHTEDQSFFIISRLLEHGDESSARFLLNTYSEDEITQVLRTSRSLSMRSRGFWMIYFDVEGEPCSPKQYLPLC